MKMKRLFLLPLLAAFVAVSACGRYGRADVAGSAQTDDSGPDEGGISAEYSFKGGEEDILPRGNHDAQDDGSGSDIYENMDDTLETARIVRVVDGDTLIVDMDGDEFRVRLIGVDTPESVHPDEERNTPEGTEASDFTKSYLAEGMTVYLQKDVSDTDRYGRLLRYVWLSADADRGDMEDICTYMYNAVLLSHGMADPMEIEPDIMYADMFQEIYDACHTDAVECN